MSRPKSGTRPIIGRVRTDDLHRSVFEGFIAAFEEGVDVARVDALASYTAALAPAITVRREDALSSLRHDLVAAERDVEIALKLAAKHLGQSKADDDEHAGLAERYDKQALAAQRNVGRLQAELAAVDAAVPQPSWQLPDVFEADAQMIVAVLRRLARCSFQLTPAECQDVHDILQLDGIEYVGDGQFRWTASLLLPYDGHVLSLGPVQGLVAATGRQMPAVIALEQRAGALAGSAGLRYRAEAAGLSRRAGKVLALASQYVPLLPEVLLTHLEGGDLSAVAGADAAWRHREFLSGITATYTDPDFRWNNTAYLQVNTKRQAITDVVAVAGGAMSNEEFKAVADLVGLQYRDLHSFTVPADRPRELPWPPSVRREGSWARSTPASRARVVSIDCPNCVSPATGVLYLPEVVGALVCRQCMGMPAAPGRHLPGQYAELLLPVTANLDAVAEHIAALRRRAPAPAQPVKRGLAHGQYTDAELLSLLRRIQSGQPAEVGVDALVQGALDSLGYVRRARAASERLRALATHLVSASAA